MIQIQATFVGYGGRPCSLFSAYDTDSRVLVISTEVEYRSARREGAVVITNDTTVPRDQLFDDSCLIEAIRAYYSLKSGMAADGKSLRLVFGDRAARANPDAAIERDGMDERGPRFRVSDSVTCAQIAALATCRYATKAEAISRTVDMASELNRLLSGHILTI